MNIGIIVPSNNQAGAQKLAAIAVIDLANHGHQVHLFVPRLPYYYYFVTLGRNFYQWLKTVRHYFFSFMRDRRFCFHDLIQESTIHANIHIHNVLRRPGKWQTSKLDRLIVMTIAQVAEMQNIFPPEKTIYQIHHPEERVYDYPDIFEELRRSFKGRIIAISPWTAEQVGDHIPTPPVVPDVVSNAFWDQSNEVNAPQRNKDILFHFSLAGHKGKDIGEKLLTTLCRIRPGTRCTVWSRDGVPEGLNSPVVKNISESALRDLYLSHKMLLFPSTFEGFGMPPIEAMACGCIPIQYPGIGASDLYVRDGITSVLIHDDVKKPATRIAELLDDDHRLGKMRIAARDAVKPFAPEGYGIRLLSAAGVTPNPNDAKVEDSE